jgi:AcrR family transcriptional regulator
MWGVGRNHDFLARAGHELVPADSEGPDTVEDVEPLLLVEMNVRRHEGAWPHQRLDDQLRSVRVSAGANERDRLPDLRALECQPWLRHLHIRDTYILFGMKVQRRTQVERRAETRARLLAAARSVFAERGYHGASLDEVSERAGRTKGALYHHFGSKEGLLLALLDQQVAGRLAEARAPDAGRPSERMPFDREFTLLFLEFVCAAARDRKLRRRLAARLRSARAEIAGLLGDQRLAAVVGAAANGASIEGLIFGKDEGAATFDAAMVALLPS